MDHPKNRLESLKANALKSLSQNFLTSPHWVDRLTDAVLEQSENLSEIWEIGPGLGALTAKLVEKTKLPIKVFEYDRKLAADLRIKFPQLEVVEGDFLKQDITSRLVGKKISLLSNLPYHLSSPILFKLLEERKSLSRLVLTFQREYAERLMGAPRTPDYGAISILIQLNFEMDSLGIIPPGAFYPKPKIDSQALTFLPKPDLEVPFEALRLLVKAAFAHRRKKLSSNLSAHYPRAIVETALAEMGVNPMARPEELPPAAYVELIRKILAAETTQSTTS